MNLSCLSWFRALGWLKFSVFKEVLRSFELLTAKGFLTILREDVAQTLLWPVFRDSFSQAISVQPGFPGYTFILLSGDKQSMPGVKLDIHVYDPGMNLCSRCVLLVRVVCAGWNVWDVLDWMCASAEQSQPGEEQLCPRGHPNVRVITVLATANFPPEWQCCCISGMELCLPGLHFHGLLFLRTICE